MKFTLKNLIFTLIGSFILALGVGLFILPNNILTGGIAGVTILIKPFFPNFNESLCIGIFSISYGGLLCGLGVGLVARQGGSTGGMDIPPLIISRLTGIDPHISITFFDAIIVILGIWIYGISAVLIGLFSIFFEGFGIEKATSLNRGYIAKEIRIISKEYVNISKDIHEILERGTTIINAKGGYSNEDRPMLLVICSNKEYDQIIDIIHKYDKEAFVIVTETKDVHGEGFTYTPRI